MKIEYKIDENDFLTYQLFHASKSERIKKKRKKTKINTPIIYAVLGVLGIILGLSVLGTIFILLGILWFFFYPIWERNHYVKHFKGFIKENKKDGFENSATLEFDNDFILAKDNASESKILTTEIEEINEIPSTIFVRLKGGKAFILPKEKIDDIDGLIVLLKDLAKHMNINYEIDDKWEWK